MSHIVHGRPDFGNKGFGWTTAKPNKPYVFGQMRQAMLVHRITRIRLYWYECINQGHDLMRLDYPRIVIAETVCGSSFFLKAGKATACEIPAKGSVPCGRCNAMPATFGPASVQNVTPQYARDHVGCDWEQI